MSGDDLRQRLHDLPPELFNDIQSLVLSTSESRTATPQYIRVTAEYEFPKQLQIDRFHREDFATQFYGNTVFIFDSWGLFRKFMSVMSDAHLSLIIGVRLICVPRPGAWRSFKELVDRAEEQGEEMDIYAAYARWLVARGEPFENEKADTLVYCMRKHMLEAS
jgi:hypothetical protein